MTLALKRYLPSGLTVIPAVSAVWTKSVFAAISARAPLQHTMKDLQKSPAPTSKVGTSCRLSLWLFLCVTSLQNVGAMDIVVANHADSGNGTLRQAIQFNESLGGGNTIVFSPTVTGFITLTNALGELLITKDVTIIGPGARMLAVSGNSAHRVFHLTNNAVVGISGLAITGGYLNAFGVNGAGILQDSGTLALSDCIIAGNFNLNGAGTGLFANGTVAAIRCTIAVNHNAGFGGGAGIYVGGGFTAMNCTIAANSSVYVGGGIQQVGGLLALTNCTLSGNSAFVAGYGGGIYKAGGTAIIRNTIIASNTAANSPDCFGEFTSAGFNLIGAINGSSGWGALGDQLGSTNSYLNPLLGPRQYNGGPTQTLAPMPGSPVIDQGNSSGVLADQRGQTRPYTNSSVSSIPLGGDRSDIGAVEFHPGDNRIIVVNNIDSGSGSLRDAIQIATTNMNITFADNVFGPIVLTRGELVIEKSLTIQGPTAAPLIVSGNNVTRVFRVTGNSTVNLSSLTISNGNTASFGAGIYNGFGCTLALSNCAVVANISGDNGGGVANNGSFTAYNCTFANNSAAFTGGGIYTYAGPVALLHCTVVSNSTSIAHGGGLCNYSPIAGTSNYLTSTLVARNSALGHHDVIGVFTSGGYNLIGQIDYTTPNGGASSGVATSGLTNGVNQDQVGSIGFPIDPKIGRLQNNGGPTPTMALLSNSPAIDQGIRNGLLTDQRGAPRPFDFATSANAGGGDGSDIGAIELGNPSLNLQKFTTNAVLSWPSYYGDFTLQSVTNVMASNSWENVVGTPTVVANQYVLTNGPISGNRFFRLKGN